MRWYVATLFCLLLFLVCDVRSQEDRLVVRKDPMDSSRFICDLKYATFTSPKGWQPNQSGGNTYAILARSSETFPNVTQMISIDIGKSSEPTTKELAIAFAKKWNGTVADTAVKVDGEDGFRVVISPDGQTLRPTNCIVIVRDARAFLLIGGTMGVSDIGRVLDELVASWKWKAE